MGDPTGNRDKILSQAAKANAEPLRSRRARVIEDRPLEWTPGPLPGPLPVFAETAAQLDSALERLLNQLAAEVASFVRVARQTIDRDRQAYREAVQDGFVKGIKEELKGILDLIKLIFRGLAKAFEVIFLDNQIGPIVDQLIIPSVATYLDRPGTSIRLIEPYLRQHYGKLADAAAFLDQLDEDFRALTQPSAAAAAPAGQPSDVFVRLFDACADALARLLAEMDLDERIAKSAQKLGELVGGTTAFIVMQVLLSATGLGVIFRVAGRAGKAAAALAKIEKVADFAPIRVIFEDNTKLQAVLSRLNRLPRSPRVINALQQQAVESLAGLVNIVADHRSMLKRTGTYNDEVAALLLIDGTLDQVAMVPDAQRLKLVRGIADSVLLEAHHIVEGRVLRGLTQYPQFKAGFAKLGWQTAYDMPAIALFNELHTRGSRGLARAMGTRSDIVMKRHISLSKVLEAKINPADYQTTRSLLEAYENVYKSEYPWMWRNLAPHFKNWKDTVGQL